jgi:predicted secreted protein
MTISAAIVLLAVIWFLLLFIALPLNIKTQKESGKTVPGTPSSAPENLNLKKKIIMVSIFTIIIWVPIITLIMSGILTISDLDFFHKLRPSSEA